MKPDWISTTGIWKYHATSWRRCGVLTAIARLEWCTLFSVGESFKWIIIVQNMVDTGRNFHQLLKGKQLYSTLYEVYTEVLHDLTAVLPKGKQPRPQLLHLGPSRNSVRKEDEIVNLRWRRQRNQEDYNIHLGSQRPHKCSRNLKLAA